ncbi:unnamed protein product, partial [Discosporangium mesarthrocarpum]
MPYTALLLRESREAMGIRLEEAVVVVDEAHNIIEAINAVHSVKVGLAEISRAHSQLSQYEARYGSRLKGKNAFYVGNILRLLRAFLKFLKRQEQRGQGQGGGGILQKYASSVDAGKVEVLVGVGTRGEGGGKDETSEMLGINQFLFRAAVDNVNIFKVQRYMERSGISRKARTLWVMGFLDLSGVSSPASGVNLQGAGAGAAGGVRPGSGLGGGKGERGGGGAPAFVSRHVSALQKVQGFLEALTNANKDGRVLASYGSPRGGRSEAGARGQPHDQEEPFLKFVMLNPAVHFEEIVRKARSIILVGGTMQPSGDLVRQLFSSVGSDKSVEVFACGHVIPKENLLPLCMARGPTGKTFNFTFHMRGSVEQLDELGRLMSNVCTIVPGGVVCFLSSYSYLDQVVARWKSTGLMQQLGKRKSVFMEPRSAKDVDTVLRDFSLAARRPRSDNGGRDGGGGLLLSVVGAKMSEGINFSDELARCVVMVGLPYPDKRDPELKQKMLYLDATNPQSGGRAGREYFQNICMRAVNQSIGRSIRHASDYSSILLVDQRYCDNQVLGLLPGWISERVVRPTNFGEAFLFLRKFYTAMQRK